MDQIHRQILRHPLQQNEETIENIEKNEHTNMIVIVSSNDIYLDVQKVL
jgi:hypothetical protein